MRIDDSPFGDSLAETIFTDISIRMPSAGKKTLCQLQGVPGCPPLVAVPGNLEQDAEQLAQLLLGVSSNRREFALRFQNVGYRCCRLKTSDGLTWFILRRVPDVLPDLWNPFWGFPPLLADLIITSGATSGLVLVAGQGRNGKSVTAVASYVGVLSRRGGRALAIEDPVEFDLNQMIGPCGQSMQIDFSGTETELAATLKGAFRISGNLAYIGEIRSPDVAAEVMRFATGAFTVVSTIHSAPDPISAIQRLVALLTPGMGVEVARELVGGTLNAVICQTLLDENGRRQPQFNPLFIRTRPDVHSADVERNLRRAISAGTFVAVENQMSYQSQRLRLLSQE